MTTNTQLSTQQAGNTAAAARPRRNEPRAAASAATEQPPARSGEAVEISSTARVSNAAHKRVSNYFKEADNFDRALYDRLGIATKRDGDNFVTADDAALGMQVMTAMLTGKTEFLDTLCDAHQEQIDYMQKMTPPKELKEFHAKSIDIGQSSLKTFRELKPLLEVVGLALSGAEPTDEQMERLGPIVDKFDAPGADPQQILTSMQTEAQARLDGYKADRRAICAQYGVNIGSWD